jgi:hypothetical protein
MTEMLGFRRKPAGWLETGGVPVTGFVAGILAEDRRLSERAEARKELRRLDPSKGIEKLVERRAFLDARVWALKVGFPVAAVDFAATAALTLKAARKGAPVTKADVEDRLRRQYPYLLETA